MQSSKNICFFPPNCTLRGLQIGCWLESLFGFVLLLAHKSQHNTSVPVSVSTIPNVSIKVTEWHFVQVTCDYVWIVVIIFWIELSTESEFYELDTNEKENHSRKKCA